MLQILWDGDFDSLINFSHKASFTIHSLFTFPQSETKLPPMQKLSSSLILATMLFGDEENGEWKLKEIKMCNPTSSSETLYVFVGH